MYPELLPQQAFAFLIVFARIGAMVMLLPGIGETTVSSRIRLTFALMVTIVIYTANFSLVPTMPATFYGMIRVIMVETATGLMIGLTLRLTLTALHTAGTVISFHMGLSAAQNFDPNQGAQGAIVSAFFTVFAILIIFATDTHHMLFRAMGESYQLFPIGAPLQFSLFGEQIIEMVGQLFALGLQLAAPFILYTLVFNTALGLVSRVLPQFQIFFIAMPANIMMGFMLLSVLMPAMMMWFLQYFEDQILQFIPA